MTQSEIWSKVDAYITERLHPYDSVLEEALAANRRAGLPAIDVSPNQGKLLHIWAKMQRAKRILEIGTLGGYSTIWLARALPEDGRLITIELDPGFAAVARSNISLADVHHLVEIRNGAALDQLALLENEHPDAFDLIFIDADKPNNPGYLQWALRFSRPGTVIIGDNVVREGEIIQEHSTDPRVQGVRKFYDLMAQYPTITATAIQTVGSKGYDGFVIGIVNG
ncbi:O-methyltransferase [Paenibacillus allorhizosphaerae]|uniref:Catechol O-methyltransferase n=1 Tax=Paenibacillus allorhizosphaerae TaxID=2849866 RepID=A0ABM8VRA5_9BACL|nr:O-methyltransferase [Paenibacillus allorhizosphaerae]CAG7654878.1 Catechol O-methyltransferase [Paenibacillus allorhizosphaerae]